MPRPTRQRLRSFGQAAFKHRQFAAQRIDTLRRTRLERGLCSLRIGLMLHVCMQAYFGRIERVDAESGKQRSMSVKQHCLLATQIRQISAAGRDVEPAKAGQRQRGRVGQQALALTGQAFLADPDDAAILKRETQPGGGRLLAQAQRADVLLLGAQGGEVGVAQFGGGHLLARAAQQAGFDVGLRQRGAGGVASTRKFVELA